MATKNNELLKRLADILEEIFFIVLEKLQHQWRRLFGARNILILGPKQSGKTSLILFLMNGRPHYIESNGAFRAPNPTSSVAIIGAKGAVGHGQWAKVARDVPGDIDFRETWKNAIQEVAPHGIIFMLDGQQPLEVLTGEINTTLDKYVLSCFEAGIRQLATLHVFLNFSDRWSPDEATARRKERDVFAAFEELVRNRPNFKHLRFGVSTTQLATDRKSWDETTRALKKFALDLTS